MKIYPTHEDRRAILERRLEISREQNDKLRAENADIKASLAAMADLMDEQAEHLGGENERLKAALVPFADKFEDLFEKPDTASGSVEIETFFESADLKAAYDAVGPADARTVKRDK